MYVDTFSFNPILDNKFSMNEIYFHNVSYISSKGKKTTSEIEIHPVNGAQNSYDGNLLYQDDREDCGVDIEFTVLLCREN